MTTTEFTTDQLKEIEEGRKAGIDVSVYENPGYLAIQMHEIRLGLLENLPAGILRQILKGMKAKVDILPYIKEGYEEEQLTQIRIALENGLPEIMDYISPILRGASIRQIRMGLEE